MIDVHKVPLRHIHWRIISLCHPKGINHIAKSCWESYILVYEWWSRRKIYHLIDITKHTERQGPELGAFLSINQLFLMGHICIQLQSIPVLSLVWVLGFAASGYFLLVETVCKWMCSYIPDMSGFQFVCTSLFMLDTGCIFGPDHSRSDAPRAVHVLTQPITTALRHHKAWLCGYMIFHII